ncbi:preprotein translocase subunit SecE [Parvimonas micra]
MAVKTTETKQAKSGFMKGVRTEFKKVVWPSKKSVFYYSLAVITISMISSVMIWGFDLILKNLLSLIIR